MLEELESIDYLVRFDEDTPMRLIEAIRPDVLVKGADYTKEQVVGWDIVESYGGRVAAGAAGRRAEHVGGDPADPRSVRLTGGWYLNASVTYLHLFADTLELVNNGDDDAWVGTIGISFSY